MSNPWSDIYKDLRAPYLQEKKGKSKDGERWQDDDCDGKWYEKSDVDGKISDREKKEKKKHYNKEHHTKDAEGKVIEHDDTTPSSVEETITLTKGDYGSRNVSTSAYAIGKSKGFKGYKAGGGLGPNFLPIKLANSYEYPKVNKPNHSNWREDFVWQDEVEEAIKRPKLDIQEKGVKNKIEVNPDDGLKEEKKKLRLPEARTRKLIPDVKVIKKSVKDMSKPVGTTAGVDYRLMAQSYEPEGEAIDEKRN